ncbi:MAG: ANTAR domain-containing protein [Gemmatimonadetes bacterium]|nr:ANTAR domain-containing protein [Gemmatimonadota bacterium]
MTNDQTPAAGASVLVVDDELAARESLSELLISLGHVVLDAVANAADAEARARELNPDAVLLDVHLPGASGIEAAQAICRALPGVAIVLISGDDTIQLTDAEAEASGAVAFLIKPVPPRVLDSTIRLAVARTGALRQARQEAADLKQMLDDRKLIERAKGILMRRTGCSEPEAYRILQRSSQDRSKRMVDIAKAVLDSEPGAAPPLVS